MLLPFSIKFLQGIIIKTPVQWPLNKGFSFSCWLRVENFPQSGTMGLFSFLTENGRGCSAVLAQDRFIYEVKINCPQEIPDGASFIFLLRILNHSNKEESN